MGGHWTFFSWTFLLLAIYIVDSDVRNNVLFARLINTCMFAASSHISSKCKHAQACSQAFSNTILVKCVSNDAMSKLGRNKVLHLWSYIFCTCGMYACTHDINALLSIVHYIPHSTCDWYLCLHLSHYIPMHQQLLFIAFNTPPVNGMCLFSWWMLYTDAPVAIVTA